MSENKNNKIKRCTLCQNLKIQTSGIDDYNELAQYHYRSGKIIAPDAIYTLTNKNFRSPTSPKIIGVIVYSMPSPGQSLRNIATGNLFINLDKDTKLALINKNIRCISRVIIEPRYRGLGLATKLVRETMPLLNVPIVEALAVMGKANPFFEKAGMKKYSAPQRTSCALLLEAFSAVGIESADLINPETVQTKMECLPAAEKAFIEAQIRQFLRAYGRLRKAGPGIERTKKMLNKLTIRPDYYIWFNPEIEVTL